MDKDCYISSEELLKQTLGEIRETIRRKHASGLTQEVLAKEIGVTREQLTRLLLGDNNIRSDYLFYLIVRLGLQRPTAN